MKTINTKIYQLLLDKLGIIANWSFETEQNGIGNAIIEVINQLKEYSEDC